MLMPTFTLRAARAALRSTAIRGRAPRAVVGGAILAALIAVALVGRAPDRAFAVVLCTNPTPSPGAGTVCLNEAHRNVTATDFPTHSCAIIPGGQSATLDGWVFVLPGPDADFTSLTLTFDSDPGPGVTEQVLSIPAAPNSGLVPPRKAFIRTPAGWTLLDGSATVTAGDRPADVFNLSSTCPAAPTPPSPDCSAAAPGGAIVGTSGGDFITGTAGNDVIFALGGNDNIKGLGGNDVICAGPGADYVDGGDGDDTISGEDGNDYLAGGNGNDRLDAGLGSDFCTGGAGADTATGCESSSSIP
jgi:hypothetical protein